jgi:hypothetical protein
VTAEPISPELALVCPDLRARAIVALLPQQPSFSKRLHARGEPLRPAPPATAGQAERTVRVDVSRMAAAYVLARATDLLAIMAAIALFVLVFAAVAGVVRG